MTPFPHRRRLAALMAAGLLLPLMASVAHAQGSATAAAPAQAARPLRLLVPTPAGGPVDMQARAIARQVTEASGVPVVVDNKPGASMTIAAQELIRAQPDGHTLFYAPSGVFAQNPHTLLNLPYDPFKDFTPVTMATRGPLALLVHPSVPSQSVADLVRWAKANPGKLNIASIGAGTSTHLYAVQFARMTGIEFVHVPYKGTPEVMRDLSEGRVQAFFDGAQSAIQSAAGGRVRLVAVAAPRRLEAAPNVPTFTEQGVANMDLVSWIAVVGPPGMQPAVVEKTRALFAQALGNAEVRDFMARGGIESAPGTPAELAAEIRVSYERWGQMVKQSGFEKQ